MVSGAESLRSRHRNFIVCATPDRRAGQNDNKSKAVRWEYRQFSQHWLRYERKSKSGHSSRSIGQMGK
jgi:hypothetical protein